jgi:hypothetical protein
VKYPLFLLPWIEGVADAFAQEIVAKHRDEDRKPWER